VLLVIDNFLKEDDILLEDIRNDDLWDSPLTFKFMDKNIKSLNTWQDLVHRIWDHPCVKNFLPDEYAGTEYWSNILSIPGPKQDLPWHFDKDEHLNTEFIENEKTPGYSLSTPEGIVTPYIGSVYYAHKALPTEGYLEIRRGQSDTAIERIQPVPNRLVIFDSGTLHRVTHITSGVRRCFATNIWIDKPRDENFLT